MWTAGNGGGRRATAVAPTAQAAPAASGVPRCVCQQQVKQVKPRIDYSNCSPRSLWCAWVCVSACLYVASYLYICVRIPLYMCRHTCGGPSVGMRVWGLVSAYVWVTSLPPRQPPQPRSCLRATALTYAHVCARMRTYAHACRCERDCADMCGYAGGC